MKILNTYEIRFTTTVDFYKKKLQPFNERTKQVFAENETQAVERGYQKLMKDFPNSSKDIWEVKNIVKRADNILETIYNGRGVVVTTPASGEDGGRGTIRVIRN